MKFILVYQDNLMKFNFSDICAVRELMLQSNIFCVFLQLIKRHTFTIPTTWGNFETKPLNIYMKYAMEQK